MRKIQHVLLILLIGIMVWGCAAAQLDSAKNQYEMALRASDPLPYYKAALEELEGVIKRDPSNYQAYAIRGLIYRQLEDYDQATENLEIAKQGTFTAGVQWVPLVINLTYGDVFHARAGNAIRAGDWERAKSYQETALEFFNQVVNTSFTTAAETGDNAQLGITIQELYVTAQGRWAAAKFQMAVIAGKAESKERQNELLREVTTRLGSVVETYPEATSLRYYLADGYRKQALTLRATDPTESQQLEQQAMSQLRACAELGLPSDLRNSAAQLFSTLSKGTEPEIEQKILGGPAR